MKFFISFPLIFLGLLGICCHGQDLHATVYFNNKVDVDVYLENPESMLTARALERKSRHGIAVDERDVPIHQEYINRIKNIPGVKYRTQSKWMNAAHVIGTYSDLLALNDLEFVDRLSFFDASKNSSSPVDDKFEEELMEPLPYGSAAGQIEMIGLQELHAQGYTGKDVIIAVTDSGFPNVDTNRAFQTAMEESRLLGGFDFVSGNATIYEDHFHGTRVLSIMAGEINAGTDQYVGSAPDASYYLFRTEDAGSETPVEMSYWVAAAERADSLGVDVINVSLGYLDFENNNESLNYMDMNGSSFISSGATIAAQKGMMVITSAGNSGNSNTHPWVAAPADAVGVMTVGSVTGSRNKSSFSSIGPTYDGRLKPNIMAQGSGTQLVEESGLIKSGNGTSYSSPIIAGAMACLIQAYPTLSVDRLIDVVEDSGSRATNPNNNVGHGIPDFGKIFQTLSSHQIDTDDTFTYYIKDKTLYINAAQGESAIPFQLFNLQGQLLMDLKSLENNLVDLSRFSRGVYLFRLNKDSKAFKIAVN